MMWRSTSRGRLKSNVRELEGALDAPDGLRFADRARSSLGHGPAGVAQHHRFAEKRVTIDLIRSASRKHFNLREQDLK